MTDLTQSSAGPPAHPGSGAGGPVAVLALTESLVEEQLVRSWAQEFQRDSELSVISSRDFATSATRVLSEPAMMILPARVHWSHSAGSSRDPRTWVDQLGGRISADRLRARLLRRRPDAASVLAGGSATVAELRSRYELRNPDAETFGSFVLRQGDLALDRVQRDLGEGGPKLPRFVVEEVRASRQFADGVRSLSGELGRRPVDIAREAASDLSEMVADHSRLALDTFERFGRFLTRSYAVEVDPERLKMLRELNRSHSLVFLPSHRSYLDVFVVRSTLLAHGFPANSCFGGNNMAFWPMGDWIRRTGNIVLRREIGDDPVYKFVLRTYLQFLVSKRLNLEWYIEGGRTRTGKLRPPRYGLLTYLVDALEAMDSSDDVYMVPISIVYDGLPEASSLAAELTGRQKRNEQITWLLNYPRSTGRGFGTAHMSIGEPLSLRAGLAAFSTSSRRTRVQRVALEICHRINEATPVTSTALVTLALLGVDDRALTMTEIRAIVAPFLTYFIRRGIVVTTDLSDAAELGAVLDWLCESEVVIRYDGGTETVWGVAVDKHLEAAFYRNSVVHQLVNRSIVELVLAAAAQGEVSDLDGAWTRALQLRDLFKFEFFFPDTKKFRAALEEEIELIEPRWTSLLERQDVWTEILAEARPHLAHRILHSFVEAYYVTALCLAQLNPAQPVDEAALVRNAYGVARQRRLQQRLRSSDSIAYDVIRNALSVATHKDLLGTGGEELMERRRVFASELGVLLHSIEGMRDLATADLATADLATADLATADLATADLATADLATADLATAGLATADSETPSLTDEATR